MKKTFFALIMGVIMISLVSSCAAKKKYSETYYQVEKIVNAAAKDINHIEDCDELQELVFGIVMELLVVPDLDKLTEVEDAEIEKKFDDFSVIFEKKRAALGCEDEDEDD